MKDAFLSFNGGRENHVESFKMLSVVNLNRRRSCWENCILSCALEMRQRFAPSGCASRRRTGRMRNCY